MPTAKISGVLTDFKADVVRSQRLLVDARNRGLPFFRIEQIAELSYLRIYLAWESFLEESFMRYLHGARTLSGSRVVTYARPRTLEHARELLIGLDRGRRYADWTVRATVTERAKLLFKDGGPFAATLDAAARDLDDMRILRDCIAHRSDYVSKKLAQVVQRHLGLAANIHPGRFLLRARPGTAETFLEYFTRVIVLAAEQVAQ